MERIGRIVAVQLRNLAYTRFGHGMITPAELFNILLNANICFEHRFRTHVQLGYPNSLAYAACLQAYRIKVYIAKTIVSNQSPRNIWLALPKNLFLLLPYHEIHTGYTGYLVKNDPQLGRRLVENFWQLREHDRLGDPKAFRAMCEYYYTLMRTRGVLAGLNPQEMQTLNHRRGVIMNYASFILPELEGAYLDVTQQYFNMNLHLAHEDPQGYNGVPQPIPHVNAANNNNNNEGPAPPEHDAPGLPLPPSP